MEDTPLTINMLKEGEEGIIYAISAGRVFSSRLAGMGLVVGARVKVIRRSGGSVIILASGIRLALGMGQAEKISVLRAATREGDSEEKQKNEFLVALAGQPNVGKTTVFNILTGLSQHVGNWPGKTVEKKEGIYSTSGADIRIVDLPGTYSLSAFSEEERVAREFIINEHPDVVILIVDASSLERGLYLLSELVLLNSPVVLAINMIDVAEDHGIRINTEMLQAKAGIPVIEMLATKNKGIKELIEETIKMADGRLPYSPRPPLVSMDHREIYQRLVELIDGNTPPLFTDAWIAVKLMEGDPEITEMMEKVIPPDSWNEIQGLLIKHEDAFRAVVGGRYDWIEEITRTAISRFKIGQVLLTDKLDHILTRPLIGIPILLGILALVFLLTYTVGFPLQRLLESGIGSIGGWIGGSLSQAPEWVRGILVDGIVGGVGSVLTFVPILIIFFSIMAFLENVGYMARAAFVMDKFMHVIGLHGKSFLPMCLGFGCNVPSVLGARIVESRKARLLTIFLAPFIPCTGRLAVLTFISAAIFGEKALSIMWSLVTINILALGFAGILISRLFLREEPVPFIMELPLYHRPDARTIAITIWTRTVSFLRKAGTIILIFSVILWFLANMPGDTIEDSILGITGRFIEPIGKPFGLDWKMITALLSSIIAKENSVATLGVLYNVGEQGLRNVLPTVISHPSALAFLVILMVFIPCMPTITVMRQEMGSWKWFLFSILFMMIISFVGGIFAYHIALAVGI